MKNDWHGMVDGRPKVLSVVGITRSPVLLVTFEGGKSRPVLRGDIATRV